MNYRTQYQLKRHNIVLQGEIYGCIVQLEIVRLNVISRDAILKREWKLY